jgi:hypothetical protein
VGVEPTILAAKDRINGFEGHEGHRTPFASHDLIFLKLLSLLNVSNSVRSRLGLGCYRSAIRRLGPRDSLLRIQNRETCTALRHASPLGSDGVSVQRNVYRVTILRPWNGPDRHREIHIGPYEITIPRAPSQAGCDRKGEFGLVLCPGGVRSDFLAERLLFV